MHTCDPEMRTSPLVMTLEAVPVERSIYCMHIHLNYNYFVLCTLFKGG